MANENYEMLKNAGVIPQTMVEDVDDKKLKEGLEGLDEELVKQMIKAWKAAKLLILKRAGLVPKEVTGDEDLWSPLLELKTDVLVELLRATRALREEGGIDFS